MDNIKSLVTEEMRGVNKRLNSLSGNQALDTFLNGSSKRIRSILAILYFKANNKVFNEQMLDVLAVGEIIHNASLLHDDVIDDANIRRGKTTLSKQLSPKISILFGDLLLTHAFEKLSNINNKEVTNNFKTCCEKMCNAEIKQFMHRGTEPVLKDYIEIAEGKTTALFIAIFKSCAVLCNSDIKKASEFANYFGTLFQLKNDLEKQSAENDFNNKTFTPKDFLGIEKTQNLIDNYYDNCRRELEHFSDSMYRKGLEDLLGKI